MVTPLHFRDKGTVKTMSFWRWTGSEKGEDSGIVRQGDGHDFLGCTRNYLYWLIWKRTNDNWSVLCVVITPVERINKEKSPHLKKKKIFFHQDNARVHTCAVSMAKIMELKFDFLQHSPGLTPQWLFFNFKLENMARRTTVHVKRGLRTNRCLFWGPSEILLFGRLKKVG